MSVSIHINNQQTPPYTYKHIHTYAQKSMKAHIKIQLKINKTNQDFSDQGIALLIPEGFRTNAIEIKMTNRN